MMPQSRAAAFIPTARQAVETVWANELPDYSSVPDAAAAGETLTGLASAALDILAYRRLTDPDAIRLVSGERAHYSRYAASNDATAGQAITLSHILSVTSEEAARFAEITGGPPPSRSLRVHVIVTAADASLSTGAVNRLDLDPRGGCRVDWYGPFSPEFFTEVATGFALFVTHMVANVFDDDDGAETFTESIEHIA